jgi:hypothetical protein
VDVAGVAIRGVQAHAAELVDPPQQKCAHLLVSTLLG